MDRLERIYYRSPVWAQNVLLNAHAFRIARHRYGAAYRAATRTLLEQERWPRERIREYQAERLRAIVAHAYERSPYYRRALERAGVHPSDLREVDDVAKLPLLEKETVRRRGAELVTAPRPLPGWISGNTSGTTGTPLTVWYDRQTCVLTNAVDRRHKAWVGIRDGEWIGLLLGRVIVPIAERRPPFWRVNRVHRQVWFSSFHMSDDTLPHYVAEIERRRLRFLEGYPSTFFVLAGHLLERGRTLPMEAVITSSETLHRAQLEAIEAAFECRVFDFYALAERVVHAGECGEHAGKHVAEEYGITEVVDDDGNPVPSGTPGYLVGTSLHNTAMPMLRYRTSDVSAIVEEPCACGRTLRRIRPVTTKAEDIVVTPDGRLISPSILTHPFKPFSGIRASQLIQEDECTLRVRIVAGPSFTDAHWAELAAKLAARLGPEMRIERELVDDIPRERSGKYRWVISRVPHRCALSWEVPA